MTLAKTQQLENELINIYKSSNINLYVEQTYIHTVQHLDQYDVIQIYFKLPSIEIDNMNFIANFVASQTNEYSIMQFDEDNKFMRKLFILTKFVGNRNLQTMTLMKALNLQHNDYYLRYQAIKFTNDKIDEQKMCEIFQNKSQNFCIILNEINNINQENQEFYLKLEQLINILN